MLCPTFLGFIAPQHHNVPLVSVRTTLDQAPPACSGLHVNDQLPAYLNSQWWILATKWQCCKIDQVAACHQHKLNIPGYPASGSIDLIDPWHPLCPSKDRCFVEVWLEIQNSLVSFTLTFPYCYCYNQMKKWNMPLLQSNPPLIMISINLCWNSS